MNDAWFLLTLLSLVYVAGFGLLVVAVLVIEHRVARIGRSVRDTHVLMNERLCAINKLLAESAGHLDGMRRSMAGLSPFGPPPIDSEVAEILTKDPIAPPVQRKKKPVGLR